ncbi:MAG: type I glyceraldehyde-3-phosphate dehydrogenase [Neptuniibacter sp.]
MSLRVAINGYGRIGRNILRALYENKGPHDIEIIAINDLGDLEINTHLTRYDSVHGPSSFAVSSTDDGIQIESNFIKYLQHKEPEDLPWGDLGIDLVFECTGRFTSKEKTSNHLKSGAKRVLVSAPCTNADATIVYGVNHQTLTNNHRVISNASCTTNCLAPLADVIHQAQHIKSGIMTTIHAYTNDQHLSDVNSGDPYRSRAAAISMIPTKTGAAAAVGLVLPELNNKLSGLAVRVPTPNVSLVDLTYQPDIQLTAEEINILIKNAANTDFSGIINCNEAPLVSVDFNHNPASCIFDCTQTHVCNGLTKVFAWYDNEWGFSNRMIDLATYISNNLD